MKRLYLILFMIWSFGLYSQSQIIRKPKLVVGIVIDQMRFDYLDRFWEKYGNNGFKRLVKNGYNFKNNHINYIPSKTAPGHASIWTGTSPMNHGIIANNYYDRNLKKMVYCVSDPNSQILGCNDSLPGRSPINLETTTIGDQVRLATQQRGKCIGISLKDRGAILPAGHSANAAYWFIGGKYGKWTTSTYYLNDLPEWVNAFNSQNLVNDYLKPWNTKYPIETYNESGPDDNLFEEGFLDKSESTFPYDLIELKDKNNSFDILYSTPFGNQLTTDFAIAALKAERLGKDSITDVLTISYSSTDYIGHNFGVNSKEIEDTYIRLDANLEILLNNLDELVGKNNYLLFLTADHGGGQVPGYLKTLGIPGGTFDSGELLKDLNIFIQNKYHLQNAVANISNNQVFFDWEKLSDPILKEKVEDDVKQHLIQKQIIDKVFLSEQIETGGSLPVLKQLSLGFQPYRSGDIAFTLKSGYISTIASKGSSHGSGWEYDTHTPLIFYGWRIEKGETFSNSEVIDIAPTICALLGIGYPSGTTGKTLDILMKQ